MTYKEQAELARQNGYAKKATHTITQWEENGQEVVGLLISIEDFNSPKFDQVCKQYLIETDEGRTSCVLGKATDFYLEGACNPGDIIAITYLGKKHLDDGRQVNQFDIDIIPQGQ
jgi:hypothetical protein